MRNDTALDFTVADHGSIVLLKACTPAAQAWLEENVEMDPPKWGERIAINRRCFYDIYTGIKAAGLVIA
jgi:hypothetical protein